MVYTGSERSCFMNLFEEPADELISGLKPLVQSVYSTAYVVYTIIKGQW